MRIPLVHGRDFEERDQEGAPGVVIINEAMARRYWPKSNALGSRLKLAKDWLEIVGISKDIKRQLLKSGSLITDPLNRGTCCIPATLLVSVRAKIPLAPRCRTS